MEIQQLQAKQVTVVVPSGELGAAAQADLKRTLQDLLDRGCSRVVVDMEKVGYVDSTAWGELAVAARRARDGGGELRLCGMSGDQLAIVTLTRLSQLMPVYPTRERAMSFDEAGGTIPGHVPPASNSRPFAKKPRR